MRITLLLVSIILFAGAPLAHCADSKEYAGRKFSLRGGYSEMQTGNWDFFYPDEITFLGFDFGWKFTRQLGLDLGATYSKTTVSALTTSGRGSGEQASARLVPVELSLVVNFDFMKDQVIVPYAAGGYTHTFYRVTMNNDDRQGDLSGYHVKGGLRFLLDSLEPDAAEKFKNQWGIENTYLFGEYYMSEVDDFGSEENDLGSKGVFGGLVFEF